MFCKHDFDIFLTSCYTSFIDKPDKQNCKASLFDDVQVHFCIAETQTATVARSRVNSPHFYPSKDTSRFPVSELSSHGGQMQSNGHFTHGHSFRASPNSCLLPPILPGNMATHPPGYFNNHPFNSLQPSFNPESMHSNRNSPAHVVASTQSVLGNQQSPNSVFPVSPFSESDNLQRLMPPPSVPIKSCGRPRYSNGNERFSKAHQDPNPQIQIQTMTSSSSKSAKPDLIRITPQPPPGPRLNSGHSQHSEGKIELMLD